ncbi:granulin a isoform X1 [Brienomyrus brachyistius]|uniref:granulin a isoform X1 n=1 Tax=Brienomyrus brachyistius TaxID=42636 RepID=UPI0020B328A4|nr:granulin a isoform X1 [Brienomyrus brachyistius]
MLPSVVLCMALLASAAAMTCPDGRVTQDGSSCCLSPSGVYTSCPLPHAVCCEDHLHCCSESSTCDLEHNKCVNATESLEMVKRIPTRLLPKSSQMIPTFSEDTNYRTMCADKTRCPTAYSCLKTGDAFGCCRLKQGVPCSDGKHCCHKGHKCSEDGRFCIEQKDSKLFEKTRDVPCDDTTACPDNATCCKTTTGGWACCPMPEAVCCDDHVHCCPHGTKCNLASSTCDNATSSIPWLEKLPTINRQSAKGQDVPCDDTTACPVNATCCKTTTGGWACCLMPEAVCCDDHVHCCPHGTKCNLASSTCDNATSSIPWLEKLPTINRQSAKGQDVPCDDTTACPDNATCCKTTTGGWACCPMPEAVCCDDHVHCCPHGTKCNLASSTCDNATSSIPWLEKLPTINRQSAKGQDVPCDDTTACPDNATCCKTTTGGWACCPMPEAVCCDDHVHCCPHGTKCNLASSTCDNATRSIPWLEKLPTINRQSAKGQDVPCDDTTACPVNATCCKTTTGGWACCLMPEAVCCDDHVHCCPHGTKCNLASSTCDNATSSIPWLEKLPTINRQSAKGQDVPCDDTTACPDNATCCKTTTGGWACCLMPEAVCCDDHVHCCPHGTKCNLASSTCDNATSSIPWLEKLPTINRQSAKGQDVPCDDTTACPDNATCCKTTTGGWACCPMPEAICCDDQKHCCPKGYVCDMLVQTCRSSGSPSSPWVQRKPAMKEMPTDVVSSSSESSRQKCDPFSSCSKDTTCCYMNKISKWGCCPLPEAVCCGDGEHCCPSGYKCNVKRTTCSRDTLVIPWYSKMEAEANQVPRTSVKCSMKDGCGSGTPCYQLPSGQLRYCPLAKAVCCSDMQHCCPSGYTCDLVGRSCTRADHRWDGWDEFITKRKPLIHL